MGKEKEKKEAAPEKKGGCMRWLLALSLLLLVVLAGFTWLTFDPQELSDIDGYRETSSPIPPPGRNLHDVLDAAQKGGHAVTLTEREINAYLIRTLKLTQEGVFKDRVALKGVWVRLTEGQAEVIIERELMGERRHTISMFMEIKQTRGDSGQVTTQVPRTGGWFGQTRVAQGYLYLVMGGFDSLAAAYGDELAIIRKMFKGMTRATINDGELVLKPPASES